MTCYYAGFGTTFIFTDTAGNAVSPGDGLIADDPYGNPFAAGETMGAPVEWDQQVCVDVTCHPAPLGTYRAGFSWRFNEVPPDATATFEIVA